MTTTYKGYKIETKEGKHTVLETFPTTTEDHEFGSMMAAMNYVDQLLLLA